MKIGIMSMQRVLNYGSFLQAYGLKSILESMGHSVEFVDYLPEPSLIAEIHETTDRRILRKARVAYKMLSRKYRNYRKEQIQANQSFGRFCDRFVNEFLPELGITEERNYCPELDALIIGSDEVFNCTQPGEMVGYSCQLFGKNHRAKRLLSYAASFGSTTINKLEGYGVLDEVGQYLKRFDYLSVRDENSAMIVRSLCGSSPEQHIDPVLLYQFPEVEQIHVQQKDYIIVYAYAGRISETEAAAIRAFAQKEGKQLVSLGFQQPFCDACVLASPLEVLAYVKNADYVITDTFHGTVFSIKYQVPFATLVRDSNRQKLEDLLIRFGLKNRCITTLDTMEDILRIPLECESVSGLVEGYRASAMTYLKNSLHGE